MRLAIAVAFVCACLVGPFAMPGQAQADIVVTVDKSSQRMSVVVDGRPRYNWAVSTGTDGGPPSGSFTPERLHRTYFSRKYDWSPMPHSIFFYHGFAIHGTNYVSRLGRRASHGCVRLHPSNAATLFELVKSRGMQNTRIVIGGSAGRYAGR